MIYEKLIEVGFTYLNPIYKEKDVGSGCVLDVNSLYPSVMHETLLPFGEPVFFEGKYEQDSAYDLYIQMFTCCFRVKKDKIPTIQLKKHLSFLPNEYVEYSGIDPVCLTLTNIDLQLFLEHYDIIGEITWNCGWKFKGAKGFFNDYIDKWVEVKNKATIEGNKRA